jgi:hemerythrin-like domain-containing protein
MAAHADDAQTTLLESFLTDHRRIEDALTRVVVALEAVDRDRMAAEWAGFEQAITRHLDAEDTHLIPALLAVRPREAQSLLHEHRHVRRRMLELARNIRDGTLRSEVMRGFVDELSAHVRRETRALYEWAEDALSDEDRDAVLGAIRPIPHTTLHRRTSSSPPRG